MLRDLGGFLTSVFTHWFSAMCGVLTVGLTCASPFVDTTWAQRLLIITAAVYFLAAAFAAWRREHDRAEALMHQVALRGRLDITFVPGERGFEEERMGVYRNICRTLSVKVSNVGGAPVRQVRVYAMSIDPNEGNVAEPMPLFGPPEELNPGDFRFRQVATYNEPGNNTAGDAMNTLHVPFRAGYLGGGERTIGRDFAYNVTLQATGDGAAAPCKRKFRDWISKEPRLRMIDINTGRVVGSQ